ncbi:hypothetical protein ACJMK2_018650 [Sinanodonta woodiana]|uniref:Uncharacterized protein n=1 Tax=Sinanodonta woodiana TaxID=1069815 RepID=A0ABD3UG33_SINWO
MMSTGVFRFIGSLFICFVLSFHEFSSQNKETDEVFIDIPVTAKSIFGPIIHRDMMEAYYHGDKTYIRIYMTVYDDKGGYPKRKDIWQDREGNIVIFPAGDRLWVGFGTPRRQLEFAYKYRNQGRANSAGNNPLIRSFLVDSKVVIPILENAVTERFIANAFDINVDKSKSPNQFGLREQSTELLRQNALSGSLVTYYMDQSSLMNDNKDSWGIVKPIEDLREKVAYPDPDIPLYDSQTTSYPSQLSDKDRKTLVALKDLYNKYLMKPSDNGRSTLTEFYNEYLKRGGSKNFHQFYKIIVPSWLSQAEIDNVISEKWDIELYDDNYLEYFRQKVLNIEEDPVSKQRDIVELEQRSKDHKMRLKTRNKLVVLFEEVYSFVIIEKDTNLGKFKDVISSIRDSNEWMDFVVGKDVSTERLEFFQGELLNHLMQMQEAYNSLDHVTKAQKYRISNQLNKFYNSLKTTSSYQERIVVSVGDKPDLITFDDTYLRYHIDSLNDNLPSAYTVPKRAVIHFVESVSGEETPPSSTIGKSHLTPREISKFLKRNFIFNEIDEIHVQSPSLSQNEKIYIFLSSLATQLRQRGEGYEERMVEANQCYAHKSNDETTVFFPELHYLWSTDEQGTLLLFEKGKYQAHSVSIDNVETLFPKLSRNIKERVHNLKSQQFSGAEIVDTLLSKSDRKNIATIEIRARKNALKYDSKRKSEEAKDFSLKDAAKDEINKLVAETLCRSSSRKKRSVCDVRQRDVELAEDSVEIIDEGIKFHVYEKNNPSRVHKITNRFSHSTKALIERQNSLLSKIHHGLSVHGALATFVGAVRYFQTGDNARGAFSLFQSLHNVGQITGLNEKIAYKLSESTAGRIVNKCLQQSSMRVASILFKDNKMIEKAASKIEKLITSVPIVGIAFDIYFIEEDILNLVENQDRDLVPLYAIDIALDSITSILSFDPLLEPVVLALSMVRMVFNDVYLDILEEWRRVKGKGVLQHLLAVIFGVIEGLGDLVTLGFVRQMRELELQEQTNMEFLKNLSTVENYFQVTTDNNDFLQLDLNTGEDHMYGGLVTVRLFDNDTFEIEIDAVPTISGLTVIKKSFNGKIRDVILGIGHSTDLVNYGMTSAKLLMFPVKDYHTFQFKPSPFPSFGQYFGNMYDNTFSASRGNHLITRENQCDDVVLSNVSLNLDDISYFISGKDGNDVFLLGPEQFRIDGGRGQDSYFIPWYGGLTAIANFADDSALDSLFLNVSYETVQCVRYNDDLHVYYCGKRTVVVQHWFASTARTLHQHLRIITKDGVTIEPFANDTDEDGVECYPVAMDLSHKTESNTIDLSLSNFQHVITVVGSNFADIITGNDNGNVLSGGLGADTLKGGEGEDVYVISSGEGCDVINITSQDRSTKRILFNVVYNNIEVNHLSLNEITVVDATDRLKTCFSIIDVTTVTNEPSVSLISIDHIIFEIKYNKESGVVEKVPLILDFSKSQEKVFINLLAPEYGSIQMSERDADRVISIMDSTHSDHIIANNEDNFLSCSGGDPDYLEGRGGQDVYVIQKGCSTAHILNSDPFEKLDRVLVKSVYKSLFMELFSQDSVAIRSHETDLTIVLLDWFVNSTYQHLVVETEDGITCTVPTSRAEFIQNVNMVPMEMRFTEQSCKDNFHTTLNLNNNPFKNVQKVVARPKSCIVSVFGNALGNHIDLGQTSVAERRYMVGQNGSDTYVVDYGYGAFNEIINFAHDEKDDHILLGILYDDLEIGVVGNDLIILSSSHREFVTVRIIDFLLGTRYQHLITTTSDGITMKLDPRFPYKTVLIVDKSYSSYSVTVDKAHPELLSARKIRGSMLEENYLEGGEGTLDIVGGEKNDTLHGGVLGNTIDGLGGSDMIYGHDGNDVLIGGPGDDRLYGGKGDDTIFGGDGGDLIDGGTGINTIVFKGDGYNQIGVFVDIRTGKGADSDADGDTYIDIHNIFGSEYNDILHGNDNDNVISGFQGNDYIHPYGSNDILTGGQGVDVYNCSDATGTKEIWLDGDLEFPDLIVLDHMKINDTCFYLIENDLFITENSYSDADQLLIIIKNFTAEKALSNVKLQIETYTISSSSFSAYALDDEIHRFKRCSWMFVLDFSESEIIILLNGSYIMESFDNDISLRFSLSYSDASMVRVTELITTSYNGSNLVVLGNLFPGVEYTITLSLLKCHIELESNSLKQYTLPIRPIHVQAVNIFSFGFEITWTLPTIMTNSYTFEVYVKSTNKTFSFVATYKTPVMALKALSPHTYYEVRVRSVVSMYKSTYSASLYVRTNATCENISAPNDGYIKSIKPTGNGYVATLACNEGFELIGDRTVVCESLEAVGNQICSQERCIVPESFKSFAVITWFQTAPWSAWEVTWECIKSFEIDPWRRTHTVFCEKGLWRIGDFFHCVKSVRCPYPAAPVNGEILIPESMSSDFKKNDRFRVSCNRGFANVGPTEITCLGSSWTKLPTCIPLLCPLPPRINHGQYLYTSGSGKAMLRCDAYHIPEEWNTSKIIDYLKGKIVPSEQILCDQGKWMSKIQNCVPIAQIVNQVNYVFYLRGHVELMPKLSWVDLDSSMTIKLLQSLCAILGLIYSKFSDNVLICKRPILLKETTRYDGVPYVVVDNAWHYVCFYKHHDNIAEDFCQRLSYSGFTVEIYKGDDFKVMYRVLRHRDHNDPILHKTEQSCDTYIRCRSKCSNPNIQNNFVVMHEELREWWFQGEHFFVRCMPGHVRLGSEEITCGSDGEWSENPICLQTVIETKQAYEGWDITFSCGKGQFVNILSANYHGDCNDNYVAIPGLQFIFIKLFEQCGSACKMNDVTVKAFLYCQNKKECSIPATNAVFSDPCPNLKKYLVVTATCKN